MEKKGRFGVHEKKNDAFQFSSNKGEKLEKRGEKGKNGKKKNG